MNSNYLETLQESRRNGRSLLAFNVQNICQLETLNRVSKDLKAPTIAQLSARYADRLEQQFGLENLVCRYQDDQFFFHLDHCQDLQLIRRCIDSGFAGVMFDGSALPVSQNIEVTRKVVLEASEKNCLVEGEIGQVGGVEDGIGGENSSKATIHDATRFATETKVSLLALGIGNAHGFYTNLEDVDFSLLASAQKAFSSPQLLVLHGGSGLPDHLIEGAIRSGVAKINYSTVIKAETQSALKEYQQSTDLFDEIAFATAISERIARFFDLSIRKFTL